MQARLDANYTPGQKVMVDFPFGGSLHGEVIEDAESACWVKVGSRTLFVWKDKMEVDRTAIPINIY
jgi:hypothetical protein